MNERSTSTHVYFLGGQFSQWASSKFDGHLPILTDGKITKPDHTIKFNCCEQYMMASKAFIFGDYGILLDIMQAEHPGEQKKLGRSVQGFDDKIWREHARDIVYIGNSYKFQQVKKAQNALIASGSRIIVEGADYDPVWGVKLDWNDPRIEDETNWRGTNWLGQCIMRVRDDILEFGSYDPFDHIREWP